VRRQGIRAGARVLSAHRRAATAAVAAALEIAPREFEAEALAVAPGSPLMLVERIAYAHDAEPVEFARDLFRGDRTRVVAWTSELA
jgi:DNA-binding GntR family transcriptional regulator